MLKRAVTFILTFVFGLIIASLFVNVMPSFEFKRSKKKCRKANQELRWENERLRRENERLKMEKINALDFDFQVDTPKDKPSDTVQKNR